MFINIFMQVKLMLQQVQHENMNKGRFIIIEGTDGAGKTTQLGLLKTWLENKGYKTKTLDFPQYQEFWGSLVGRFLAGEFGTLDEVDPYLASPLYMLDQSTQSKNIRKWLKQGYFVLSNRYVTSSMGHQTAKFLDTKNFAENYKLQPARIATQSVAGGKNKSQKATNEFKLNAEGEKYLAWLNKAAYEELDLVKEDLTIMLFVDPDISHELSKKALERKKNYTQKSDIAEENKVHQILSAYTFRELANRFETWELIDCMKENNIETIENIHAKVVKTVEKLLKI
jgi:dTMP kinase